MIQPVRPVHCSYAAAAPLACDLRAHLSCWLELKSLYKCWDCAPLVIVERPDSLQPACKPCRPEPQASPPAPHELEPPKDWWRDWAPWPAQVAQGDRPRFQWPSDQPLPPPPPPARPSPIPPPVIIMPSGRGIDLWA
jgi:hypothetical protein